MNLKLLAIDPATKCGFAHSGGASGTWDLSIRRDESAGMRLVRLRGKLDEVKRVLGVDVVAFEAARHAAPKMQGALVVQSEIQGVIKLWCIDNKVDFRGFSPSEVKKHATGKGNANKAAMLAAAAVAFLDVNIVDDNHADALFILSLLKESLGGASLSEKPLAGRGERAS